jgi:hypothetical protein
MGLEDMPVGIEPLAGLEREARRIRLLLERGGIPPGTMRQASIEPAAVAGDQLIVKVSRRRRIAVISYVLIAVAPVVVRWRSGEQNQPGGWLSGPLALGANLPLPVSGAAPFAPVLKTDLGEPLVLNLAGNVQVGGHLVYLAEPEP